MLGIDPGPLTVRELFWRLHGKQRYEWGHTASMCATIANAAPRGKKSRRVFTPNDFSPYRIGRDEQKISFKDVLKLFGGGHVDIKK